MGSAEDITKIRVGKFTVGIIGLQAAIAAAAEAQLDSDEAAAAYLLQVLKQKNYIPAAAEAEHARAFLREYKKYKGEPIEDVEPAGLEVKILGPGCPNCEKLEQLVMKVMAEHGLIGDVEHVRDPHQIAAYGFVATPALVVNGKLKCSGRLPREDQVHAWLREATESAA